MFGCIYAFRGGGTRFEVERFAFASDPTPIAHGKTLITTTNIPQDLAACSTPSSTCPLLSLRPSPPARPTPRRRAESETRVRPRPCVDVSRPRRPARWCPFLRSRLTHQERSVRCSRRSLECAHIANPSARVHILILCLQGDEGRQLLVPEQASQLEEDMARHRWMVEGLPARKQARTSTGRAEDLGPERVGSLLGPCRVVARAAIQTEDHGFLTVSPSPRTRDPETTSVRVRDVEGDLGAPAFLSSHSAFLAQLWRAASRSGSVRQEASFIGMGVCKSARWQTN